MADRVRFSRRHRELPEIAAYHQDLAPSLRLYFSAASPSYLLRFDGYTATEVTDELRKRLEEADLTSSLTVLTSLEAAFRIDYLQRCYLRGKDPVSRAFRNIYKSKRVRASLEDEIFDVWAKNSSVPPSIISELRGAFRFRHWLAHGRYWTPKFGRRYDYPDVFQLADLTLRSFPFYGL
ncbi:MAG: hypothetical protein ACYDC3_20105 [Candidatus Binataceae bacterium]